MDNGTLSAGETSLGGQYAGGYGIFVQKGGIHTVKNPLILRGTTERVDEYWSSYSLSDGVLRCPSLSLQTLSWFYQTGGSNLISGTLTVAGTFYYENLIYELEGGTLASSNTVINRSTFAQSGGTHIASNSLVLQFAGYDGPRASTYALSGGFLLASNIDVAGIFSLADATDSKTIYNPGRFSLNGTLRTGNVNQDLGRFILAGNSHIEFGSGASTYAFDDSSAAAWTNGSLLIISNWNGMVSGENALPFLAVEGIPFSVEGPATYERLAPLRNPAAVAV